MATSRNNKFPVIRSVIGLLVLFLAYFIFYHPYDPTANNVAAYETKQYVEESRQRLYIAVEYLKQKDYENAKNTLYPAYPENVKFESAPQQETNAYGFATFMLLPDNDSITKYSYIQYVKPIDGVLTQAQIDRYISEWKPKSEELSASIRKQTDVALADLTDDERAFVKQYSADSADGKKLIPVDEVSKALHGGTLKELQPKADKWMNDLRIQKAIEQYISITTKAPTK